MLLKRWVAGELAEIDEDDINRGMYELARKWMAESKLRNHPGHISKATDLALWKQFREYKKDSGAVLVLLFRCPMLY